MKTDRIINFFTEAGKLKRLPRTGWIESGIPNPESVADHSYRVALIALVLADMKGLDSLKVVRMALLHDLAEGETGDLTPLQKEANPEAKRVEDKTMTKLFYNLPEEIREVYRSVWYEFSDALTEEARLVRDADKLEMVIQAYEYQKEGSDRSRLMRFWHAEIKGDEAKAIRDSVKLMFK